MSLTYVTRNDFAIETMCNICIKRNLPDNHILSIYFLGYNFVVSLRITFLLSSGILSVFRIFLFTFFLSNATPETLRYIWKVWCESWTKFIWRFKTWKHLNGFMYLLNLYNKLLGYSCVHDVQKLLWSVYYNFNLNLNFDM